MKIVSNVLENVEGIQIFYVVGLLIFVALFIVIVIRTIRRPAKEMIEIKKSILNDNDTEEIIIS
jgi:hypothetical protein